MRIKKQKLISLFTLFVFVISNYSSVFASINTTNIEIDNSLVEFKNSYLNLDNNGLLFDGVVDKNTKEVTNDVEESTQSSTEGELDGDNGKEITIKSKEEEQNIGDVKLVITNKKYPLENKGIKQYSLIDGPRLVLPQYDNKNVYDVAYLLFTPNNNIGEIEVINHDNQAIKYTNNFEKGKTYLLNDEVTKIGNLTVNDPTDTVKQIKKEIINMNPTIIENSISDVKEVVTEDKVLISWKESENVSKPSYENYKSQKVRFYSNNELKIKNSQVQYDQGSYSITIPKTENIEYGFHAGAIYSVDEFGRIVSKEFSFMNNPSTKMSIESLKNDQSIITENRINLIDGDNLSVNINVENKSATILKEEMPTGELSKNTIYYLLTNSDGLRQNVNISESNLANGLGKTYSMNFVAEAAVGTRSISQPLLSGEYTLKIVATGEYPSDKVEYSKDIKVVSERPNLTVDKNYSDNNYLIVKESTPSGGINLNISNNQSDLIVNNDISKLGFNLRLPEQDSIKKLSAIVKNETTAEEIAIEYDSASGALNKNINLTNTGKYIFSITNLETTLGYTISDISSKTGVSEYKFILDKEKPVTELAILNEQDNSYVENFAEDKVIKKGQVLGLKITDLDFDNTDIISGFKVINKKTQRPVNDAKFNKVTDGLYKLSLTSDGEYSLSGKVKDKSGNESDIIQMDSLILDRVNITDSDITFEPYTLSSNELLPSTDRNLYHYKDKFIGRVELPFKYAGYEKIKVSIDTKSPIIKHYSTNIDASNSPMNISTYEYNSDELEKLQYDRNLDIELSKYLTINKEFNENDKEKFEKLALLTNNTFKVTIEVYTKNNASEAVKKSFNVNLDDIAPIITEKSTEIGKEESAENNEKLMHYIYTEDSLNLEISNEREDIKAATGQFNIDFSDKNLKSYSLKVKNQNNKYIVNEDVQLNSASKINYEKALDGDSWYIVDFTVVDINNNTTKVKYKLTVDNKAPKMQFVVLDADKANDVNHIFEFKDLEKFEFESNHKIDNTKVLAILMEDLSFENGSETLELIMNNNVQNNITLDKRNIVKGHETENPGDYRLYVVNVGDLKSQDGQYSIKTSAADVAGNKFTLEDNFILDNNIPEFNMSIKASENTKSFELFDHIPAHIGTQGDYKQVVNLEKTESGYSRIKYVVTALDTSGGITWESSENINWDSSATNMAIEKVIPIEEQFGKLLQNNNDEVKLKITIEVISGSGIVTTKEGKIFYDTKAPEISLVGNDASDNNDVRTPINISTDKEEPSILSKEKVMSFNMNDKSFVDSLSTDLDNSDYNTISIEEAMKLNYEDFKMLPNTKKPFDNQEKFKSIDGLKFVKSQSRVEGDKYEIYQGKEGGAYVFTEGAYKLKLKAIDLAGNVTEKDYYFIVDTTLPVIEKIEMHKLTNDSILNATGSVDDKKYYVNDGFKINFEINESISANNSLKLELKNSKNEVVATISSGFCTIHGENEYVNAGKHSFTINLNELLENNSELKVNTDLSLDIKLSTNSGREANLENPIKIFFDTKADKAIFESKESGTENEVIAFDGGKIFTKSQDILFKYENNSGLADNITIGTESAPNTLVINSVKKQILGQAEYKEIYTNETTKEISSIEGYVDDKGNKIFAFKNGADKYNFSDGKYKVSIILTDACGNAETQEIDFIVDTQGLSPVGNGNTYKFEGSSLVLKPFNINGNTNIEYTASESILDFSINNMISGYNDESFINITKRNGSQSVFDKNSYDRVGISENGKIIGGESSSENKNIGFKVKFPDTSAYEQNAIYDLSINLISNSNEKYTYNLTIVCDYENPTMGLTVKNHTGLNDNKYYSNHKVNTDAAHYIEYDSSDNNFSEVSISGLDSSFSSTSETNGILGFNYLDTEGNYLITATAIDKVGRKTSYKVDFIYDITKPAIRTMDTNAYNSVEGVYYTNKVRPYDYDATDVNLKTERITVNNTVIGKGTSISGDSVKAIEMYAEDYAGNTSKEEFSFILDTIKPEISQEGIVNEKYYNKDVKSKIAYSDTYLDKESYVATLNGAQYVSEDIISKDGEYVLNYQVKDYAGNVGQDAVKFVVDKIAPVIAITGIAEDRVNPGIIKPIIEVDDPTATVTALLNGDEYIGSEIEGVDKYTLLVIAADKAGNVAKKAVTFMLDSEKPVITLEDVADGDVVGLGFRPRVSATKDSEIKLLLNGKEYDGSAINEEGEYTLEIIATDKVGNVTSETIKFTVKNLAAAPGSEVNDNNINYGVVGGVAVAIVVGGVAVFTVIRKRKVIK